MGNTDWLWALLGIIFFFTFAYSDFLFQIFHLDFRSIFSNVDFDFDVD